MEPYKKELKSNARTPQKVFLSLLFFLSTSYFYGSFFKELHGAFIDLFTPVLIVFFYLLVFRNLRVDKKSFAFFFMFITILFVNFFGTKAGNIINNLSMAVYLLIFYCISVNEAEIAFFKKLLTAFHFLFLGLVLILQYKNGHVGDYNANNIAMQAATNVFLFNIYPTKSKTLWALQNITGIFIIIYCRSRSALVAVAFFVIMMLFSKKLKASFLKLIYWVMILLGIGIPILLTAAYNNRETALVSELVKLSTEFFGKSFFTGRELIWSEVLNQLFDSVPHFLLGIGTEYAGNTVGANFHSSLLTICVSCGILGFLIISLWLYRFFVKGLKVESLNSKRCCIAYLSMMVISQFEFMLFSGPFALLAYMMLVMADIQKRHS